MKNIDFKNIDLFAATPAVTLSELRASHACFAGYNKLLQGLTNDCKLPVASLSTMRNVRIPLLYVLQNNGIRDAIWCMRIDWHEHKQLYMQFVAGCAAAAHAHAAVAAADADAVVVHAHAHAHAAAVAVAVAAAAADAAAVAVAAADAAYAAAAYAADAAAYAAAAAADAERKRQQQHLAELLTETKTA